MNYREELLAELKERFGENYEVQINDVKKTNGTEKVSVVIFEFPKYGKKYGFGPTYYLDSKLDELANGTITVQDVADEIFAWYRDAKDEMPNTLLDMNISAWSKEEVLRRITVQMINAERNERMLTEIPHRRFIDLAVVYRCQMPEVNGSFLVSNVHTEYFGITRKELEAAADKNTKTDYIVKSMNSILEEMGCESGFNEDAGVPAMYVATNEEKLYGAAVILRSDILKNLSEKLGDNLIILPSSTHEIVLVPEKQNGNIKILQSKVAEVNRTQVDPEEFLSNQVYKYNMDKGEISIA